MSQGIIFCLWWSQQWNDVAVTSVPNTKYVITEWLTDWKHLSLGHHMSAALEEQINVAPDNSLRVLPGELTLTVLYAAHTDAHSNAALHNNVIIRARTVWATFSWLVTFPSNDGRKKLIFFRWCNSWTTTRMDSQPFGSARANVIHELTQVLFIPLTLRTPFCPAGCCASAGVSVNNQNADCLSNNHRSSAHVWEHHDGRN